MMSGQKVCKVGSMKAPESKGMIRESYKHLAKLGKFFFFKNFYINNHSLTELVHSVVSELGAGCGTRNSVKVQIQKLVAYSDSETGCKGPDRRLNRGSVGSFVLRGVWGRLRVLLAVLPSAVTTVLPR